MALEIPELPYMLSLMKRRFVQEHVQKKGSEKAGCGGLTLPCEGWFHAADLRSGVCPTKVGHIPKVSTGMPQRGKKGCGLRLRLDGDRQEARLCGKVVGELYAYLDKAFI